MKRNFLVHSIRPATLFRESATCSISDEKIHRRVPIFSCSFSTFSRRKRPGSLKFAIVLAVIMSFAHVKEGVRFHFSLKNFFFVCHAGGRQIAEYPAVLNAQIEHKYRCAPLKTVSGPYLSSPDELESICMRFRKRRSRLTTSELQLGRVSDASTVNFAFPCPAAMVPAPSRTELHSDLTNCI